MKEGASTRKASLAMALAIAVLAVCAAVRDLACRPKEAPSFSYSPEKLAEIARSSATGQGQGNTRATGKRARTSRWVLDGIVVDEQGSPVENARVAHTDPADDTFVLSGPDFAVCGGVTDSAGRFSLPCDSPDATRLTIRHRRFLPFDAVVSPARRTPGEDASYPVYTLEEGGTVRGRVVAVDRGPLEGVTVVASRLGHPSALCRQDAPPFWGRGIDERRTVTSSDGRFSMEGLDGGVYEFQAVVPGMTQVEGTGVLGRTGDEVEIVIAPLAYAVFRVVDAETGLPVGAIGRLSGRPVGLEDGNSTWWVWGAPRWADATDREVRDSLGGTQVYVFAMRPRVWPIPGHAYLEVQIKAHGYQPCTERVRMREPWSQENAGIDRIELVPDADSGTVVAEFRDARGELLSDRVLPLPLCRETTAFFTALRLRTNERGCARFRLPAGTYREYVPRGGQPIWTGNLPPVSADRECRWALGLRQSFLEVSFVSERGGPVKGPTDRIFYARNVGAGPVVRRVEFFAPVRRVMRAGDVHTEGDFRRLRVNAQGEGLIGPLEPDVHSFEFRRPGYLPATAVVTLEAGEIKTLVVTLTPSRRPDDWYPRDEGR